MAQSCELEVFPKHQDSMLSLDNPVDIFSPEDLKNRCRHSPHILLMGILLGLNWGLSGAFLVAPAYISSPEAISLANFTTISEQLEGGETAFNVITSSFSLGNLIFAPIFGWASDKWGRRPLVILSVFMTGVMGLFCSTAQNIKSLMVFRFIQGIFYSPSTLINWVLLAESTPKKSHGMWAFIFGLLWIVGSALVAPIVIISHSWRYLLFYLSLPNLLLGIVLFIYLQESLDYSLLNEHHKSVAKFIERNLPKNYVVDMEALGRNGAKKQAVQKKRVHSWNRISHHKNILLILFTSCYMSFAYTLVHNAMSLTSTVIQFGNVHVNFVLSSLVELPSYAVVPLLFHWTGEKGTLCFFHTMTAFSGFSIYFISPGHWLYLFVWMLTKFSSSSAFMCVLVYMSSQYPVEYRNFCVAITATFGNAAAVFAPQVYLLESLIQGGMFLLFGFCTTVAIVLTLLTPNKI